MIDAALYAALAAGLTIVLFLLGGYIGYLWVKKNIQKLMKRKK
jgi:uncharacterized protein YneF (UPF0154 family)